MDSSQTAELTHPALSSVPGLFCREIEKISFENGEIPAKDLLRKRNTPVLMDGLAARWPALSSWTAESLSKRFGNKTVRVYNASFGDPGKNYMDSVDTMSFARFLHETLGEGRDLRMFLYNIGRQIPELLKDVYIPDLGVSISKRFVYSFFGCHGAVTPLHYDIDMSHVLYTSIQGRRRIRLFAPDQSTALHKHPFTVRSYVDLDAPDQLNFPGLKAAKGYQVIVQPGQSLFIPSGYWHEVQYLDAGFGVSLRAVSNKLTDRLRGLFNLLLLSPVDRISNKLMPDLWFNWKQRAALRRGLNYINNKRSS